MVLKHLQSSDAIALAHLQGQEGALPFLFALNVRLTRNTGGFSLVLLLAELNLAEPGYQPSSWRRKIAPETRWRHTC